MDTLFDYRLDSAMIFKVSPQKKPKPQYRGASLFPVLSANKLLASDKKQIVLEKIKAKVDFPQHYYQLLYGNLLHDFFLNLCNLSPLVHMVN